MHKLIYIFYLLLVFIIIDFSFSKLFIDDEISRNKNIRCSHPYYHHDLIPNATAKYTWGNKEYRINTNNLGFKDNRNNTVSLKKSTNIKRLLLIGDSFVEGIGVEQEDSFHELLNKEFSPTYEILNAGVVSYSPKLMYHKLKYLLEVKGLELDEIWVFVDLTDVFDEIVYESFKPEYLGLSSSDIFRSKVYAFALNNSFLINSVYNRIKKINKRFWLQGNEGNELDGLGNYDRWTYDQSLYEKSKIGQKLVENYTHKIIELCKAHDLNLSFVIFPRPNQIIEEYELRYKNRHVQFWEEICSEENVRLINLWDNFFVDTPEVTVNKYFIPGDMHWNEEGHSYVYSILKTIINAK